MVERVGDYGWSSRILDMIEHGSRSYVHAHEEDVTMLIASLIALSLGIIIGLRIRARRTHRQAIRQRLREIGKWNLRA
jgi:bisphosphoglycerate-dependent phosphoglycerate mutase